MKSDLGLYQRHGSSSSEKPDAYSRMALLTAINFSWKERFFSYTILNGNSYKMKYIYLSCKVVTSIIVEVTNNNYRTLSYLNGNSYKMKNLTKTIDMV